MLKDHLQFRHELQQKHFCKLELRRYDYDVIGHVTIRLDLGFSYSLPIGNNPLSVSFRNMRRGHTTDDTSQSATYMQTSTSNDNKECLK